MTPFAEIENVSLPAVTLTPGSPNRFWLAGNRMKGPFRPVCTSVKEPSGWPKNFPGPFSGTVMVFPVCRFVYEAVTAPVKRNVMDPSAALRALVNSMLTGKRPGLGPRPRGREARAADLGTLLGLACCHRGMRGCPPGLPAVPRWGMRFL